jgi:hypothetical protein
LGEQTTPKKFIHVDVDKDAGIKFMIDIHDPNNELTCGWLIQEVICEYHNVLKEKQKLLNAQVN